MVRAYLHTKKIDTREVTKEIEDFAKENNCKIVSVSTTAVERAATFITWVVFEEKEPAIIGKWIDEPADGIWVTRCSHCDTERSQHEWTVFCPDCGAKMTNHKPRRA